MSNPVLYVITVLVWGSTWLAIEYQLGVVPPEVSIDPQSQQVQYSDEISPVTIT